MSELQAWADRVHKNAVNKGFWDYTSWTPEVYLSKMALIDSEVAEILEAYRKEKGADALADEFADVFIRLADLYMAMLSEGLITLSFDQAVMRKADKNEGRPHKHGNLI